MPDILDVAQKQINEATTQAAAGSPPSGPPPPPPPPPEPTISPPPKADEEKSPPKPEPTSAKPPSLMQEEDNPPDSLTAKTDQSLSSLPPAPEKPTEPATPPPPPFPKGVRINLNKNAVLALTLFLLVTLPLSVYFVSQQRQLANLRSRAQDTCYQDCMAEPDNTSTECRAACPPPTPPPSECGLEEIRVNCPGVGLTCVNRFTGECPPPPESTIPPSGCVQYYQEQCTCNNGNQGQYDCQGNCGNCILPPPPPPPPTEVTCGAGNQGECFAFDCPRGLSAIQGNCAAVEMGVCCKAQTAPLSVPCGVGGECFAFDCPRGLRAIPGNCGSVEMGVCCKAETAPLSVPCGTGGECFAFDCPRGLSAIQGNCASVEMGVCCKAPVGVTPPPGASPPPGRPPGDGGEEPPPGGGQCRAIKIYKNNQLVEHPETLKPGDSVVVAVVGEGASRARMRVNGSAWYESSTTNSSGEFVSQSVPVPTGVINFTIEAEVFREGVWR